MSDRKTKMPELEDLDPGSKKATERLNRFFCEENESIEDLSKQELLWYLRQVLLWYDLANERIRENE